MLDESNMFTYIHEKWENTLKNGTNILQELNSCCNLNLSSLRFEKRRFTRKKGGLKKEHDQTSHCKHMIDEMPSAVSKFIFLIDFLITK